MVAAWVRVETCCFSSGANDHFTILAKKKTVICMKSSGLFEVFSTDPMDAEFQTLRST